MYATQFSVAESGSQQGATFRLVYVKSPVQPSSIMCKGRLLSLSHTTA
jgi:hypothetical protein